MKWVTSEKKSGTKKAHFVSLEDKNILTTGVHIRHMVEPSPDHDDRKERNAEDIAIDLIEELDEKEDHRISLRQPLNNHPHLR